MTRDAGASEGSIRLTQTPAPRGSHRTDFLLAAAAFAMLCVAVLTVSPLLVEPDDWAYRASIVAITQGHFLTLSTAQVHALAAQVGFFAVPGGNVIGPGRGAPLLIPQWVQLGSGRWISEKHPGYPFLAAPFQAFGIIRVAPLFYGVLGCLGLFVGVKGTETLDPAFTRPARARG